MAVFGYAVDTLPAKSPVVPLLPLYQRCLTFDPRDIRALIRDFFSWFEQEWRQPVLRASSPPASDLLDCHPPFRVTLDQQQMYTLPDLAKLAGFSLSKVKHNVSERDIHPIHRLRHPSGGHGFGLYLGRDLAPVVEEWEWAELCRLVDSIWLRFVREPCGNCGVCLEKPHQANFRCQSNNSHSIRLYRRSFFYLLRALRRYGDFESWWDREHEAVFECRKGAITEPTKLVLLYLLDRHLLDLSYDDMLRISFRGIEYIDLLRPLRHRRPEEYDLLLRAMKMAQYGEAMQVVILAILAVLVVLKHGLPGLSELGRRLTPEEVQQVVREERLLSKHLGYGFYLGLPLSDDIRVGHVILDEIRQYFWRYAAAFVQETGRPQWDLGPRSWSVAHIQALERVLTANLWDGERPLLAQRPETQVARANPYCFRQRAEREGGPLHAIPPMLREALQAFINYRYVQQQIELSSLSSDLIGLMSFFSWAKEHTDLSRYVSWDRDAMRAIVRAYLEAKSPGVQSSTLCRNLVSLHVFFAALAEMGLPHPPGYAAILAVLPSYPRGSRAVPPEELFDRLFKDGVCRLDYDPYARLALTIQYFCGTRVTETCDLPVFCLVEDADGRFLYLVIPLGKSKQERSFPIASIGMGPLLDYMDQVVRMQVDEDGKLRNFSRANVRYLDTDPERAYRWDYLFDRQHYSAGRPNGRQQVLNLRRVNLALKEAMLLAARINPSGFFQQETYSASCRRSRAPEEICRYFALHDGVFVCPVCGGSLPGKRGDRCNHRIIQAITCDGVSYDGSYFCPKCDAPLAELVDVTSHAFRHNSVTRAFHHGVPLAQNMLLHGHQTVPMHLRYLHLLPEDQQEAVNRLFSEKLLREMRLQSNYAPGQVIEGGVAHTATVEHFIALTLQRELKRGTAGYWGGFWTGALAGEGARSPTRQKAEIIITNDTYDYMVAQYRYESLCLAVSEVALERGTKGKYKATVPPFLERREIERVVDTYLEYIRQGYLSTARGVRLIEADMKAQRLFLEELAEMLCPWWQHLGSIDALVGMLFPERAIFQKPGASDAIKQE